MDGRRRLPAFEKGGGLAELGIHTGFHHHGPRTAGRGRAAGVGHVRPRGERGNIVQKGMRILLHGNGVSGKKGFLASEAAGNEEAGVRRDIVPGFEQDDIPLHQPGGGNH